MEQLRQKIMPTQQGQKNFTDRNIHISVVTPVYGYHLTIDLLYTRLRDSLLKITNNFEIIMVNDASPDNAWNLITKLSRKDLRVRGINLSRNFGQHHAITAGFNYVRGDWIVVMDCDLQDQPEEIITLYKKAQEGYDIVFGRRVKRKDFFMKKFSSKLFHQILRYLSGINHDAAIANFGIYSKKVINAVNQYQEQYRAFGILIHHIGFRKISIPIKHAKREKGKSSYTFRKRTNLAIDTIVANSNKPLLLSIRFGFLIFVFTLLYTFWLFVKYFILGVGVAGWTSLMVSIYLIGGLLFMNMGFLGLYIGKVFDETKKRPLYLIQDTTFDTFEEMTKK